MSKNVLLYGMHSSEHKTLTEIAWSSQTLYICEIICVENSKIPWWGTVDVGPRGACVGQRLTQREGETGSSWVTSCVRKDYFVAVRKYLPSLVFAQVTLIPFCF